MKYLFLLTTLIYLSSCSIDMRHPAQRDREIQDSIRIDSITKYIQDTMRIYIIDSLTKVNPDLTKVSKYWNGFDLKLPEGTVLRGFPYEVDEYKMDSRKSTKYDFGIIVIEQDDGKLVYEEVSHNTYIVLKIGDVIR